MKPYSALEIRNLTVAYDTKPVLWNINMDIPTGQLVAVIGPNGAGKTTLIKAALQLLKPLSGTVQFPALEGVCCHNKIAYVPQSGSVDWDFPATVLDVVMMGRYGHLGWLKRPGKQEKELSRKTLELVEMDAYAKRQISQLSGGQQQRVFLARALVQQAEIYFMDEPLKGVDARTEQSIIALLKSLKEQGKTVIVVHHDLRTVFEYFDWATMLNTELIANGPIKEVFHKENLVRMYGGNNIWTKGMQSWGI